ncbi:MAG: glutamate formimidoyltransferase [Armatimonadetes bacterium]|nr:glutamate formimidoyltransferase [Armatimonadota bacterium]
MELVQCVPNFSEGRDAATVAALEQAIRASPGVALVDRSADPDHHRCVLTYLGPPAAVARASLAVAQVAVERIDLTRHAGQHPRMGALDVLPFVPVGDTSIHTCITLARETGARLAAELHLPVYYYEEAASRPERRNLAWIRSPGFEGLRSRPLTDERAPDCGPAAVHPTAGAVAVGARGPLLAYNVYLRTEEVEIARAIARRLRERDGGLVGVKALGLWLASRGQAQVSVNITRPAQVPLSRVFEFVRLEAARYGVTIAGSELIGAARLEELLEVARSSLGLHDLQASQVLDLWAARLAAGEHTGG